MSETLARDKKRELRNGKQQSSNVIERDHQALSRLYECVKNRFLSRSARARLSIHISARSASLSELLCVELNKHFFSRSHVS